MTHYKHLRALRWRILIFLLRHGFGRFRWLRRRLPGHWERYKAPLYRDPHANNFEPWIRIGEATDCARNAPNAAEGEFLEGELECEDSDGVILRALPKYIRSGRS